MYTNCMPSAHGGQKRVPGPLEQERQVVVSHRVVLGASQLVEHPHSAGNGTQPLTHAG